jgi:hypothetical protein
MGMSRATPEMTTSAARQSIRAYSTIPRLCLAGVQLCGGADRTDSRLKQPGKHMIRIPQDTDHPNLTIGHQVTIPRDEHGTCKDTEGRISRFYIGFIIASTIESSVIGRYSVVFWNSSQANFDPLLEPGIPGVQRSRATSSSPCPASLSAAAR